VQPGGPVSCPRVAAVPGVATTGSEGEGVPLPAQAASDSPSRAAAADKDKVRRIRSLASRF